MKVTRQIQDQVQKLTDRERDHYAALGLQAHIDHLLRLKQTLEEPEERPQVKPTKRKYRKTKNWATTVAKRKATMLKRYGVAVARPGVKLKGVAQAAPADNAQNNGNNDEAQQ